MAPDTLTFDDTRSRDGTASACWLVRAMQAPKPFAPPVAVELPQAGDLRLGRGSAPIRRETDGDRVTLHLETDDERMSSSHARLVQRDGGWVLADQGSKNGSWVRGKRVTSRRLDDGDWFEIGGTMFVFRRGAADPGLASVRESLAAELPALRTAVPELAGRLSQLARVAGSLLPVLILGETGTGKELVARAIHELGARRGELVAVNCGAIPPTLLESQLFGHTKGAFSGADRDAPGWVRSADGGTLFLDEIAELSEPSQVALLRVLQEQEVVPVGSTTPVAVDVRVVAATHRDLEAWIADGRFRDDLYARVAGAVLQLVPLRERKEDIGLLVASILTELTEEDEPDVRFTRKAMRALFSYDWPRNIRELRTALELALTAADDRVIAPAHLPDAVTEAASRGRAGRRARDDVVDPAPADDAPKREILVEALRLENGNVSAAARRTGYSRAHFNRLMKQLDIDPSRFRA